MQANHDGVGQLANEPPGPEIGGGALSRAAHWKGYLLRMPTPEVVDDVVVSPSVFDGDLVLQVSFAVPRTT